MLELALIVISGSLLYALLKPPAAYQANKLQATSAEQAKVERTPVERMPAALTGPTVIRHDALGETKR